MPTGPRIRANNIYGIISDNPLAAASTVFNSASLPLLPIVSVAHAVLVFDPKRVFGDPEIVVVTVHTAASTVASLVRGRYGTSQRVHPQGTVWAHVPIDEDFTEVLTSSTRPTDPYEGQSIYETDTNKLFVSDGTSWVPYGAGGQLGYAQLVSDFTGVTSEADVPGCSVQVTVPANRRIKITSQFAIQRTVADGLNRGRIKEDGSLLVLLDGFVRGALEGNVGLSIIFVKTPSAGTHTYKLTYERVTGTGTMSTAASGATFILVEDIGSAL